MDRSYWLFATGRLPLASCFLPPSIASSAYSRDSHEGSKKQKAKSKKQLSCDVFILFLLFITLLLGGCTSSSSGESKIMRELRETNHLFYTSDLIQTSYFFYPSTMRMVNVDDMPHWNEAVQDVRRLSVMSMWPDRFDASKRAEVIEGLQSEENFSLYAELEDKYSDFKLLGRENGREAILIYNDSTANYVIHLLGKLNYVKLMKLSSDLREMETTGTGLSFLKKAMGQETDRAIRQRRYSDRRKEREKIEQLRKDSIEASLMIEAALNKESVITE